MNKYCARDEEIANCAESTRRAIHDSQNAAKINLHKILQRIVDKEPPQRAERNGGLYVGASGISYAFLRLAKYSLFEAETDKYLSLAERYLRSSLALVQQRHGGRGPGFLLGLYVCIFKGTHTHGVK